MTPVSIQALLQIFKKIENNAELNPSINKMKGAREECKMESMDL
jgi:hypothetical protein